MAITRALLVSTVALAAILALSACEDDAPVVSGALPDSTPSAIPTAGSSSSYDANGTAADNLAYFEAVGKRDFGPHPTVKGVTIVNDLVAAGFDKTRMEITPDKTSIGLNAWNIEFSVRMKDSCLIGQTGNVGFWATVQPVLSTGKCLIGTTRKIDW